MIGYILYYIGSEFGSVHVIYIKTQANTLKVVIFFFVNTAHTGWLISSFDKKDNTYTVQFLIWFLSEIDY